MDDTLTADQLRARISQEQEALQAALLDLGNATAERLAAEERQRLRDELKWKRARTRATLGAAAKQRALRRLIDADEVRHEVDQQRAHSEVAKERKGTERMRLVLRYR